MDPIKDIIPDVLKNLSNRSPQSDDKIQRIWNDVIGEERIHTRVSGFDSGKLMIHVDTSTRMYKLKIRQRSLLKRIVEEIPEVKDIVFKIGKVS